MNFRGLVWKGVLKQDQGLKTARAASPHPHQNSNEKPAPYPGLRAYEYETIISSAKSMGASNLLSKVAEQRMTVTHC